MKLTFLVIAPMNWINNAEKFISAIRHCSCRKVDFAAKKNNPMGRITAASKVFFRKTNSLEKLWMVIEGVRCVMCINGISLKNGSRPLWIPSYSNDHYGFQVEARSATVARDTRRRWFGGAARGDRSSRGKKATAAVAGNPSVRKPLLRDTDGRYPGLAEAARKHVERRTETERRRCQLRDRARIWATPDLRGNFSRERQLLRERNRKGAGFGGGEDGCIILTTLRKLWQHSIIGPALCSPLPAVAMNRLSHP